MTPARMLGPLRGLVLALTAAGTLAASSAQAQLPGDNSNAPIDITANGLELIDAQRVQVWSGAVEAVQGTNRLRGVFYPEERAAAAPAARAPVAPAVRR